MIRKIVDYQKLDEAALSLFSRKISRWLWRKAYYFIQKRKKEIIEAVEVRTQLETSSCVVL